MKEKILLIWKHLKQDLSVRQTLLESHDPVYTAWSGRNRCLSGFQSDFQRSGRYYYRTPDRETYKYLCRNDRLLCRKHSGFAGIRICLYFH